MREELPRPLAGAAPDALSLAVGDALPDRLPLPSPAAPMTHAGLQCPPWRASRPTIALKSRPFNSVLLEEGPGLVWKASRDAGKIAAEAAWLRRCDRAGELAPALLATGVDGSLAWHCTRFVAGPTLSDLLLGGPCDWGAVIGELEEFATCLHVPVDVPGDLRVQALSQMLEGKTTERIARIPPSLREVYWHSLEVSGRSVPGLRDVLRLVGSEVKDALGPVPGFSRVHGDLCAGNIVRRAAVTGTNRLCSVDPRGSFGSLALAGDPLYDLAKLSHSFLGGYDFTCAGRFELASGERGIDLRVQSCDVARAAFREWLKARAEGYGRSLSQVRLVEALLFVSLVPLHAEDIRRQEALLLTGLSLLGEMLE